MSELETETTPELLVVFTNFEARHQTELNTINKSKPRNEDLVLIELLVNYHIVFGFFRNRGMTTEFSAA